MESKVSSFFDKVFMVNNWLVPKFQILFCLVYLVNLLPLLSGLCGYFPCQVVGKCQVALLSLVQVTLELFT